MKETKQQQKPGFSRQGVSIRRISQKGKAGRQGI